MPKPAANALSAACLLAAIALFFADRFASAALALGASVVFDLLFVTPLRRGRETRALRT
jgi:hypothetical protein